MSVQYRPELGTIGLTPGYADSREREYLTDTANSQQAPNFYAVKQRQIAYGMKIKNQGSPISPLSPPDSSQAASEVAPGMPGWSPPSYQSETSSHSDASFEGQPHQEGADFYGGQYRHADQLKGSSAYPSPSSVLGPVSYPPTAPQTYRNTTYQPPIRHYPQEQYAQAQSGFTQTGQEMSTDVQHMLQVLESALLDDDEDTDLSGSLQGRDITSEGSWADTIEELLAADSSPDSLLEGSVSSGAGQNGYKKQYPTTTTSTAAYTGKAPIRVSTKCVPS